jgi:hypothetical protein
MFSKGMTRIDPTMLATTILEAPGWARVGITAPSPYMRYDAAMELALAIAATVEDKLELPSGNQSALDL